MSSKSKKNTPLWYKCDNCEANFSHKDVEIHSDNCPPSLEKVIHPFILDKNLYGQIDIKKGEDIKGLSTHDKNNLIFLSQSAIQICSFVIGDWAVVNIHNSCFPPCARIVWPTTEKAINSVLVTQSAYDSNWKGLTDIKVKVSKLELSVTKEADKIILVAMNAPKSLQISQELNYRIKKLHLNRYITMLNKLSVMFYGKLLIFQITEIIPSGDETKRSDGTTQTLVEDFKKLDVNSEDTNKFYKITDKTTFKLFTDKSLKEDVVNINPLSLIGGVDTEITEIQDYLDVALGKTVKCPGLKISRGILLYGASGTGKTIIANAVAQSANCHIVSVNGPDVYSKCLGETETAINALFKEALNNTPSIILLDEMDVLCPARSSRITDQEKRVVATILNHFDSLHTSNTNCRVCIIATSSRPDFIDPAFRRFGRIDREIEIPIPNPIGRFQILKKLLLESECNLTEEDLREIANSAHGFVGSDLVSLCSRAAMHCIKRSLGNDVKMNLEDLKFALTRVRPSAMRSVQIEIPDVKWSDIGGQHQLKLILRQAVEWPLKHADSFVRLGITPPRGVLMFGPPGCSKTMIAKALATESGLNFLSIKGPELFSKWVGESERAVRDVFRRARQVAPSIVFFDEIDALGGERSSGSGGSASVQERVLAQLLTELDGVVPLGDVTVLAATNRPDRIDKALLRPGRLDRIVYVPLPDEDTRKEIFILKLSRMPHTAVDVDILVKMCDGYSGAEIQAVCHEAAMKALEEDINASRVMWKHFEKALKIVTPRTPQSLLKIYEDYLK